MIAFIVAFISVMAMFIIGKISLRNLELEACDSLRLFSKELDATREAEEAKATKLMDALSPKRQTIFWASLTASSKAWGMDDYMTRLEALQTVPIRLFLKVAE
jgi:hypothetical protein